ncbi:MAG: rRNA maturation RNase YbeY [Patescibacteria group bacterium]
MLDLVFRDDTRACPVGQAFFVRTLARGLHVVKAPALRYEMSISIVGEKTMRALNWKFRHMNRSTDVLSFPLGVQCHVGYTIMALGDIFICLPVARRQARQEGVSLKRTLAWLAAHGFLHLHGYDHERSVRHARIMTRLEQQSIAHVH